MQKTCREGGGGNFVIGVSFQYLYILEIVEKCLKLCLMCSLALARLDVSERFTTNTKTSSVLCSKYTPVILKFFFQNDKLNIFVYNRPFLHRYTLNYVYI